MNQLFKTILLACITTFITFSIITFPEQSLEASHHGLNIWWGVVFPSLLPFFITAELLIGFGVVKFVGVLFEPIMRPLFNVPGSGSFAWIMGMASGYPSGAKITVRLREEKQLSKIEAERLLSFTNASSPLFIFGAVSIGLFHDAKLGVLIAASHYLGNALVGICMRYYGMNEEGNKKRIKSFVSFKRAFKEMHETRIKDPRPFGEIVSDAVLNSVKTLVMIGGFIVLFSVFTKLLFLIGITPMLAMIVEYILKLLSLPVDLGFPLITGLFEITIGSEMVSKINYDSLLPSMIAISFILGFNGFSVQAQVSSIIAKSDIRFTPYFIGRILHALFASLLTILFYKPLYLNKQVSPTTETPVIQDTEMNFFTSVLHFAQQIGPTITLMFLTISIFILYRQVVRRIR